MSGRHRYGRGHGPGAGDLDRHGRRLLAALLIPFACATIVGLVLLWPAGHRYPVPQQFQAPDGGAVVFVRGTVTVVEATPCRGDSRQTCRKVVVRLDTGPDAGTTTMLEYGAGPGAPPLQVGDRVRLARATDPSTGGPAYLYDDMARDLPLGLLAAGFAVIVVLVARWRGLAALVGLGVAYAVLVFFLLPALLPASRPCRSGSPRRRRSCSSSSTSRTARPRAPRRPCSAHCSASG